MDNRAGRHKEMKNVIHLRMQLISFKVAVFKIFVIRNPKFVSSVAN